MRYGIALDAPPAIYCCHCHVCQRATGSAFAAQAVVPVSALSVAGSTVTAAVMTDGRVSVQHFCGACHARFYNTNSARPDVAIVRAGTLDRSEELECRAHIFTDYRQRWVVIWDDVPHWPEAPDPDAFVAAMMR